MTSRSSVSPTPPKITQRTNSCSPTSYSITRATTTFSSARPTAVVNSSITRTASSIWECKSPIRRPIHTSSQTRLQNTISRTFTKAASAVAASVINIWKMRISKIIPITTLWLMMTTSTRLRRIIPVTRMSCSMSEEMRLGLSVMP